MTPAPIPPPATAHLCQPLELRLPLPAYLDLFRQGDYAFFLDSALDSHPAGSHSFLGGDPFLVLRAFRQPEAGPGAGPATARCEILQPTPGRGDLASELAGDGAGGGAGGGAGQPRRARAAAPPEVIHANPFDVLQQLLDRYAIDRATYAATPVPFLAGAVGYLGYEAGHFLERLPPPPPDDLQLPDLYFMFCDQLLAHCHRSGHSFLSVTARGPDLPAARRLAQDKLDRLRRRIDHLHRHPPPAWAGPDPAVAAAAEAIEVEADFDEPAYAALVRHVQRHIRAGDIYQACLTHRLHSPLDGGDPWQLYQELRRINPAPFASFLQFPEVTVASASPERFLKLDHQRVAESRPIKGTRPRSCMPEADLALRDELAGSGKDRAENVMIVDLVRNDFGRVCQFHSVHVPQLMAIEAYATVLQMVSTVQGTLRDDVTPLDLVRACFPGGSMTGAPKIEAMKILAAREPVGRSIYSGAIGYFDFAGVLDLSIVIRTFLVRGDRCYYHVGGAIVADSDPRGEYLETMTKARALKQALANLRAAGEERVNGEE